jgi:two-component system chemotaxis sensor kinase CheA
MNELTTQLEADASHRASLLRMVQTAGIVLALGNFIFILFKFIRRLRLSDDIAEQAHEENREILSAVREGLFLLTPQVRIGTQISNSVGTMFGRVVKAGDGFLEVLGPLVSPNTLSDANAYVDLLFASHVEEGLVQSINPLSEVELFIVDALGKTRRRHLSLQFNRVMEDEQVRRLLVTVPDVTTRVELEARLQGEQRRAQREFELLMRAFETDAATLGRFIEHAESSLLKVNDLLRNIDASSNRGPSAVHRSPARPGRGGQAPAQSPALERLDARQQVFERQGRASSASPENTGDSRRICRCASNSCAVALSRSSPSIDASPFTACRWR